MARSTSDSVPSVEEATQLAMAELRLSIDSGKSSSIGNGVAAENDSATSGDSPRSSGEMRTMGKDDRITVLQRELDKCRQEKEALGTQYQNLVSRLNNMRTTLGNKLKQDAEELDRREQLIQQLTAQNEDLTTSLQTLKSEVVMSNAEAERSSKELIALRSCALEQSSNEALVRERELRELQVELEHCRMQHDEWEREALEGRVRLDEAKTTSGNLRRDLEIERGAREREHAELESEREKCQNLQSVLADFQAAKDHEIREAVRNRDAQLTQVTRALAEYKHRAHTAELQIEETSMNINKSVGLEKEVKEKVLLIGKLRHEAVILNAHLTEALRRLRKNQTDNNVDRRLVTNVLLQYLTTPRGDSKRFEMLSLLSSILSWGDVEREKAGLQRAGFSSTSSSWKRSQGTGIHAAPQPTGGKGVPELELIDETESFSQLWVEFLLRESSNITSSGNGVDNATASFTPMPTPPRINHSLPGSPSHGPLRVPRLSGSASTSMIPLGATSNPNLPSLLPPNVLDRNIAEQ